MAQQSETATSVTLNWFPGLMRGEVIDRAYKHLDEADQIRFTELRECSASTTSLACAALLKGNLLMPMLMGGLNRLYAAMLTNGAADRAVIDRIGIAVDKAKRDIAREYKAAASGNASAGAQPSVALSARLKTFFDRKVMEYQPLGSKVGKQMRKDALKYLTPVEQRRLKRISMVRFSGAFVGGTVGAVTLVTGGPIGAVVIAAGTMIGNEFQITKGDRDILVRYRKYVDGLVKREDMLRKRDRLMDNNPHPNNPGQGPVKPKDPQKPDMDDGNGPDQADAKKPEEEAPKKDAPAAPPKKSGPPPQP